MANHNFARQNFGMRGDSRMCLFSVLFLMMPSPLKFFGQTDLIFFGHFKKNSVNAAKKKQF